MQKTGLVSFSTRKQVDPWAVLILALKYSQPSFFFFFLFNMFHLVKKNMDQEEGERLTLTHLVFQAFRCNGGDPCSQKIAAVFYYERLQDNL